ncbi:MAG: hypothetical protein AAGU01_03585 [Clostridiaceae bacterium]
MKVIKSITEQGIHYADEDGKVCFVSFAECNENWIQYRKRVEQLNDDQVIKLKESSRCVGQRDICANPMFIEFFTRPFTRFEFNQTSDDQDPKIAFTELKNQILSYGWTTLDMS